jgi:hypothetical protein
VDCLERDTKDKETPKEIKRNKKKRKKVQSGLCLERDTKDKETPKVTKRNKKGKK